MFCLSQDVQKEDEEKPKVNAFEIKAAANVVDNYMNFIMKEDYENGKKLYTKELSKKVSICPLAI